MLGRPDRLPTLHSIWYGLAGMTWYMVWPTGHGMVFGMAWEAMAWYMVLPGYTWYDIWYGLGPWHGICYGMTGIWYGLAHMAWYMVWPGWHDMVWPGG